MGFVLDAILRQYFIGSKDDQGNISYENINVDGNTDSVDISGSEGGYLTAIEYANGSTVNIRFFLEGSIDDTIWGEIPSTANTITDNSGSIQLDVTASNINFIRVAWEVTSGSLDIFAQVSAKRRH